jgi:hypothetical protein
MISRCSQRTASFSAAARPAPRRSSAPAPSATASREVNFTFDGHKIVRHRGVRVLNHEELQNGDVSLEYVGKLMQSAYTDAPTIRKSSRRSGIR